MREQRNFRPAECVSPPGGLGEARLLGLVLLAVAWWVGVPAAPAADWPQLMGNSAHTGDAPAESLQLPLGLATCVRLEDAVTTAPAVVQGKVYVVDQMGTAYCIDPVANRVRWKSSPDGPRACGGNTSSVCVAGGRVYYGTTAGQFHILDAATGKPIRSIDVGWPITGSPVWANDSVYFQTLGAVVHCLDALGNERWRWEHYRQYQDPKTNKLAQGFPGSYHDPHYGGGELAVAGRRVLVPLGWDLFCLEDQGRSARLVWCNRAPLGKDAGIPTSPAIAGDWVYVGMPSTDQMGGWMRVRLADGRFDPKTDFRSTSYPGFNWAVVSTPAVRDATAFVPTHYMGISAQQFDPNRTLWSARTDNSGDQKRFTPCLGSPVLTKEHCVFGTVFGELYVVAIGSTGSWPAFQPAPYKFTTPFGKPIASTPAVAEGRVYFGCDDGYLYGLAPGGKLDVPTEMAALWEVRSRPTAATGKRYGAPVASMSQANTNRVEDAGLKPPLRLRWALRPFDLRVQMSADDDSLYFISEAGTLAALEQASGRIRWRLRIPGPVDGWKQLLLDQGRLFVTRNGRAGSTRSPEEGGASFSAFEAATGKLLWQQPWGSIQGTCRSSPVIVGDVVAGFTAEGTPPRPLARAFDARTGKPLWQVDLAGEGKVLAGGACVLDGVMYFSCGQSWGNGSGSTVAVEPSSGKVIWSTKEYHVHGYGRPTADRGRLYLGGQSGAPMYCLNARDGTLVWQEKISYSHHPAIVDDWFIVRGYGGHGLLRDLNSGQPIRRDGKEVLGGCPDHACSPVLVTSGRIAFAVSSSGLYARDLNSGQVVWQSLGFAPRACTCPVAANGRLFFSPNVNNMLYCFEPAGAGSRQP
jgi:outer membrane protein assembly factor BamB